MGVRAARRAGSGAGDARRGAPDLERDPADNDENLYALGSIGGHNVAIVCLPAGRIGNNPAAAVSTQMRVTFKAIRFGLMVGIGGGVPSTGADIRLRDVVVSQPHTVHGGVVQYDVGKTTPSGFERTGSLNSPPHVLLSAVVRVRANELRGRSKLLEHASKLERVAKFQRVKTGPDVLFEATYDHDKGQTCDWCSVDRQVPRQLRESNEEVVVHYGTIASGNQVMKSAVERNRVSKELGGVLCFEMEAAGLMNSFPCLVIRGICDYADSHKNKAWQPYAAATAAAYAKEVLSMLPPAEVAKSCMATSDTQDSPGNSRPLEHDSIHAEPAIVKRANIESSSHHVVRLPPTTKKHSHQHNLPRDIILPRRDEQSLNRELGYFLPVYVGSFHHYDYRAHLQDISRQRYRSTCCWALHSDSIRWLCAKKTSSILWMSGCHGLGKSTILAHLVEELHANRPKLNIRGNRAIIYSFCSDEKNNTASKVLSIAIHQVLVHHPEVQAAVLRYDQMNFVGVNMFQPKRGKNRPAQVLWRIFVESVREAKLDMLFLIVDGLDHCTAQCQTDLVQLFGSALYEGSCIKILFSSVPSHDIKKHISHIGARRPGGTKHQELGDLEDYINTDIGLYVNGEVARISKDDENPLSPTEQARIKEKLSNERAGAFLPTVLLLREIEERGHRTIAEILEDIPKTLQALYQDIVCQITTELHGRQIPALGYLLYSITPLTSRDLAYACYVLQPLPITLNQYYLHNDVGVGNLASLRRDLLHLRTIIKWRNDGERVDFIHPTSKQYLIQRSLTVHAEPFLPQPWEAHGNIASVCLKLILAKSELDFPQPWADGIANEPKHRMVRDWPLLGYALRYWSAHVKEAISQTPQNQEIDRTLMQLIQKFTVTWNAPPAGFRYMLLEYWGIEGLTKYMASNVSIVEIFSGLGLTRCLEMLLQIQPDRRRTVTPTIQRAVLLAIRGGHEESFDLLVRYFNITSLDGAEYEHIISESAWSRHFSLLVKAMCLRKPRLQELVEAINIAITTGERATLHELTKDRAVFDMRDQQGRTCLHHMFISRYIPGNAQLKQLLAQAVYMAANRVDMNAQDRFGFTALHYVCWSPYLCVVELIQGLIRHGADVFAVTKGGLTPFHLSVFATREPEVIQLFLRLTSYQIAGVKSSGLNTPLYWAVQRRYTREDDSYVIEETPYYLILKLLVHAGADPYARNRRGLTVIQSARYQHINSLLISTYENADQIRSTELVLPKISSTFTKLIRGRDRTGGEAEEADHEQLEPQEYFGFVRNDVDSQDAQSFCTAQETLNSGQSGHGDRRALWRFWVPQRDLSTYRPSTGQVPIQELSISQSELSTSQSELRSLRIIPAIRSRLRKVLRKAPRRDIQDQTMTVITGQPQVSHEAAQARALIAPRQKAHVTR